MTSPEDSDPTETYPAVMRAQDSEGSPKDAVTYADRGRRAGDILPNDENEPPPQVRMPTETLVGLLLMILSWELTAALFAAHLLLGPAWLTPGRRWTAFGVSAVLSLYARFRGVARLRACREAASGRQLYFTPRQAALVVLMVAAGAFGAWLFMVRD